MQFDPITFLELTTYPKEKEAELRQELYQRMAQFLIEKFVEGLEEGPLDELQKKLDKAKTPQQAIELIEKFDPSFSQKKLAYLEMYKKQFLGK
jgi:hypothetical protein